MATLAKLMVELGLDDKMSKGLFGVRDRVTSIGKGITNAGVGLAAAVTLPAIAAGGALLKLGSDYDSALDTIRVGTGATGAELEKLGSVTTAVWKSIPTDLDTAATAVSELTQRTDLSGKSLEGMAKQVINLSDMTGTDLVTNIAASTRMFGDWGIATDDQAGALDKVFRASQATGVGVDSLMQSVVQFGAPLRQMGFSFEESIALLAKFEKEGVNAELVMGSMRIALGKMASEGITDTKAGLISLVDSIKNAGSAGEATALAMEYFGARAGPDMAAAIREGRFEVEDLLAIIEGGGDTINGAAADTWDFAEQFQILKNNIGAALLPLAKFMFGTVNKSIPLMQKASGFVEKLSKWMGKLPGPVKIAMAAFVAFAVALGPIMIGIGVLTTALGVLLSPIGLIVAAVVLLGIAFSKNFLGIRDIAGKVVDVIGAIAHVFALAFGEGTKVSDLVKLFPEPLQKLAKGFLLITDAVGDLVSAFRSGGLSGLLSALPGELRQIWEGLKNVAGGFVDLVIDGAITLGSKLLEIAADFGGWIWKQLKNTWDNKVKIGEALIDGTLSLGSYLYGISQNFGQWLGPKLKAAWDKSVDLGTVFIKATLRLATDTDWSGIARDVGSGIVEAVRTAVITFSPLDMYSFTFALGQAIGPAIGHAVTAAFNAFKADPIDAAKVALKIALAISAVMLSPILLPAILGAALASMVAAAIAGLVSGIADSAGIDFAGVASGIASGVAGAIDTSTEWGVMLLLKGAELIGGLSQGMTDAWPLIVTFMVNAPTWAFNAMGNVAETLLQKGKDLIQGLWDGAVELWIQVGQWLGDRGDRAFDAIGDLFDAIKSPGEDLIDGLWEGMGDIWENVYTWLGNRGSEALAAVGDLYGYLKQSGADLVQGLIDGIESRIPGLEWTIGKINGLIDLIDRSGSPWPMFVKSGGYLIDGLVIGIDRQMGALESIIGDVNHSIDGIGGRGRVPALSAGGFAMPAGIGMASAGILGSSGGGDTYHITIAPGAIQVSEAEHGERTADVVFAKFSREFALKQGV